jgi:hypothetical protein
MSDTAEIKERMKRLLRRVERRDDYGTLLAAGQMVGRLDEWRIPTSGERRSAAAPAPIESKLRTGKTEGIAGSGPSSRAGGCCS